MMSDLSPGPCLGPYPRLASGLGMHMGVCVCVKPGAWEVCSAQSSGMGGLQGGMVSSGPEDWEAYDGAPTFRPSVWGWGGTGRLFFMGYWGRLLDSPPFKSFY